MDYTKKLLEYLKEDSFIIPRSIEEYDKELNDEVDYWINSDLSKQEIITEIRGNVYPSLWAGDLMTIINQLAWMILHERKEHKRVIKELKNNIKLELNSIEKLDYEYNHECDDLFKDFFSQN